jgi:hypothetical protein
VPRRGQKGHKSNYDQVNQHLGRNQEPDVVFQRLAQVVGRQTLRTVGDEKNDRGCATTEKIRPKSDEQEQEHVHKIDNGILAIVDGRRSDLERRRRQVRRRNGIEIVHGLGENDLLQQFTPLRDFQRKD